MKTHPGSGIHLPGQPLPAPPGLADVEPTVEVLELFNVGVGVQVEQNHDGSYTHRLVISYADRPTQIQIPMPELAAAKVRSDWERLAQQAASRRAGRTPGAEETA